MSEQKIMFFDIDGTLIPEGGGNVPDSAVRAIRRARENGHLMFINSGRCMQNIEPHLLAVGFDGVVAGCGTNIYCHGEELFHAPRDPEICRKVVCLARECQVDIVYESRERISIDRKARYGSLAVRLITSMKKRGYDLSEDIDRTGFSFDKFIIWADEKCRLADFLSGVSAWYQVIARGGSFYEFVPLGYSKATGIRFLLDRFGLPISAAYAVGDSMNDLPMLEYVPGSIAMGNSTPELFSKVSYVTSDVREDGIARALRHFRFIA